MRFIPENEGAERGGVVSSSVPCLYYVHESDDTAVLFMLNEFLVTFYTLRNSSASESVTYVTNSIQIYLCYPFLP